jgi:excisionase family DNA binding protein
VDSPSIAAGSGNRVPKTEEVPAMDQRDDTPATMTVEDAGRLLGISRRAAYRAAAAGHLPVIRLGRRKTIQEGAGCEDIKVREVKGGQIGVARDQRLDVCSPRERDEIVIVRVATHRRDRCGSSITTARSRNPCRYWSASLVVK